MDDSRTKIVECRNCGAHTPVIFDSGDPGPRPTLCTVCGTVGSYSLDEVVRLQRGLGGIRGPRVRRSSQFNSESG